MKLRTNLLLTSIQLVLPLLATVSFLIPTSAQAGESYHLLMFSSQRPNYSPNQAHTFATFVKLSWPGEGPCPRGGANMEAHTISWLPADLTIHLGAVQPEPGHNFGLHETIRVARSEEQQVSLWGPFPIERELYCKALERIRQLESGSVRYKANDTGHHTDRISNCIHAVSSIAGGMRVRVGSPGWGDTASYVTLRRLRPWLLDERPRDYWLASALGLDVYPILYREGRPIGTGLILGPINEVLGRDRDLIPRYGPPRQD